MHEISPVACYDKIQPGGNSTSNLDIILEVAAGEPARRFYQGSVNRKQLKVVQTVINNIKSPLNAHQSPADVKDVRERR